MGHQDVNFFNMSTDESWFFLYDPQAKDINHVSGNTNYPGNKYYTLARSMARLCLDSTMNLFQKGIL
jgi:hypothetical protein